MSVFRGRKYTMLFVIFLESLKISNVEASKGKKKKKEVQEGETIIYSFILKAYYAIMEWLCH